MTLTELTKVIRERFDLYVAQAIELPTQYDNAPFERPENDIWARCNVLSGDNQQISMGAVGTRLFRRVGVMSVQLFVPVGLGDRAGNDACDAIETNFRSVSVDGIVWYAPSQSNLGRQGKWWRQNVTCPFKSDTIA